MDASKINSLLVEFGQSNIYNIVNSDGEAYDTESYHMVFDSVNEVVTCVPKLDAGGVVPHNYTHNGKCMFYVIDFADVLTIVFLSASDEYFALLDKLGIPH